MEIQTKFDVHNLVKRKFDVSPKNQISALEIMEIISQTCYAGTQVFYLCKPIVAHKEFADKWKEDGEYSWAVAHGISQEENQAGWKKYREDELVEVSKEIINIILGIHS